MDQAPISDGTPVRLCPGMESQRLLVLAFVRNYLERFQLSPSQGEIAHGLGIPRQTVRNALRSLERDGLIVRGKGPRGLSLPSLRDEAVRQLVALGWCWKDGVLHSPSADPLGDPDSTLPGRIVLSYP